MCPPGSEPLHPETVGDWPAMEAVIKRFEQAWRRGLRPAIEDYLPDEEAMRQVVLVELVHTELELRLVQNDPHKENLLQITALFRAPHGTHPTDRVWRTRCVQTYINLRGYLMGQTEVV